MLDIFKILFPKAGQFGVAQTRHRAILLAAAPALQIAHLMDTRFLRHFWEDAVYYMTNYIRRHPKTQ